MSARKLIIFYQKDFSRNFSRFRFLEGKNYAPTSVDTFDADSLRHGIAAVVVDESVGYEQMLACVHLLRRSRDFETVPVIAVCTSSDTNFAVELFTAGVTDIVEPSMDNSVFLARIESHLRAAFGDDKGLSELQWRNPEVGDRIAHYCLESLLGAGGMGFVFYAKDLLLDRYVAIKVLPEDVRLEKAHLQRFQREAQIMARVNHPQVIQVLDVGTEPCNYIVMQYVEGDDIDQLLVHGNFAPLEAARVIRDAAYILQAVHNASIIHRDLKPGNIMIDVKGQVHLLDFGISKLLNAEVVLTKVGNTMGTPAYMAPEQLDCESGEVGFYTDIYSLGLILYEMIIGDVPFRGEGVLSLIKEILGANPMSLRSKLPNLSPVLNGIVLKATARNPRKRYQSAQELGDALAAYIQGES